MPESESAVRDRHGGEGILQARPAAGSGLGAWRIQWSDPTTQFYAQQIGRADSFHWIGDMSAHHGATWTLVVEILARRRA